MYEEVVAMSHFMSNDGSEHEQSSVLLIEILIRRCGCLAEKDIEPS
jgi:hypothetical protein